MGRRVDTGGHAGGSLFSLLSRAWSKRGTIIWVVSSYVRTLISHFYSSEASF